MIVDVIELSRRPGQWVHQLVLVASRDGLSHDNALHYSNLGNVNLQSLNHSVNLMVRIQEALFISITHTLLFSDSVLNLWETRTKCGESQLRRCHTVERVYMYVCVSV